MKLSFLVCLLSVLPLLIGSSFLSASAQPSLSVSLSTNQSVYRLLYTPPSVVDVWGNLTVDGTPVSDGLVALTVFQGTTTDYVRPVLFRTLTTGVVPSQNWSFSIISVNVGEWVGYFQSRTTFPRPSTQAEPGPVFNVTFYNANYQGTVYLTLTVFDADMVPIATRISALSSMPINATASYITDSIYLADWVALGNATVYVSAFDNVPPWIYFPLCPEVSNQFVITSGSVAGLSQNVYSSAQDMISQMNGNYNFTFKINYNIARPLYSPWGNYTIKVSSYYQGYQAINSKVVWVRIPGDLNGDGAVDIKDAALVGIYWQQTVPPADPMADYNGDGIVSIADVAIVGAYWGKHEQF